MALATWLNRCRMKNPSPGSCFGGLGRLREGTGLTRAALTATMRRTPVVFIAATMARVSRCDGLLKQFPSDSSGGRDDREFHDSSVVVSGCRSDTRRATLERGFAEVGALYPDRHDCDDEGEKHGRGRGQEGAGEAGGQGGGGNRGEPCLARARRVASAAAAVVAWTAPTRTLLATTVQAM